MRAGVGFMGVARETSLSPKTRRWSVPSFSSSTAKLSPRVPSSKFTLRAQSNRIEIAPRKLKPRNLILGASSNFTRKFPPTKITRYTVVPWLNDHFEEPVIGIAILEGFQNLVYDRPIKNKHKLSELLCWEAMFLWCYQLGAASHSVMLPYRTFLTVCSGLLERRMLTTALLLCALLARLYLCNNYILQEHWPRQAAIITFAGPRILPYLTRRIFHRYFQLVTRLHIR